MNTLTKYYRNPVCLAFIITFLGFLSLSFLGQENKIVRLICSILSLFTLWFGHSKHIRYVIKNDSILKSCYFFFLFSVPSIFFCTEVIKCGFKLLDLLIMVAFVALGTIYFNIDRKKNVFKFLCYYCVLQTIIAFIGYFVDPTAIASDNGYGNYVTFLHCNYPPIHGNSIGEFGSVTIYLMICLYLTNKQKRSRFLYLLTAMIGLSVLYLSSSRTCIISGVVGLIFLFFRVYKTSTRLKFIVVALCVGVYFSHEIINTTMSILMKKQNDETLSHANNTADAIMSGRLSIWQNALDNPYRLILGMGYGVASSDKDIGAGNTHNSIVEILFNSGIFALFAWLFMWIQLFRRYHWLCIMRNYLPVDIIWLHLAAAILIMNVIRSMGNISFVYLQMNVFAVVASIILIVYSTLFVKKQIKNRNTCFSN